MEAKSTRMAKAKSNTCPDSVKEACTMVQKWHLAQMNVGTIRYLHEDPRMSGFMNRLDEINALADHSPGFVWRLQSDSGNATDIDVGGKPLFLANMSVWDQRMHCLATCTNQSTRRCWFSAENGLKNSRTLTKYCGGFRQPTRRQLRKD
ncbi:MAG: hypothetical protein ACJAYC_000082 [Halieaceae bacterium]|jgi:hypothetical protein